MLATVTSTLTLLIVAAIFVRADPNPSSPGPGDVFIQGKPCTISWDVDPTGLWKTMNIELMTGDNFDMVSLTPVGTVDGTNPSKNTYSYTCPQVTPHSPIYFYQFTSPSTSNKTWTGRFTITDSANDVVPPSQSTQKDGTKIPWGTGSLVNGSSSAVPSASSSSSASSSTSSSAASITTGSTLPSVSPSDTSTPSVVFLTASVSATPSTVSSRGENGAMARPSVSNILFQTGLALGLAAFGLTVIF